MSNPLVSIIIPTYNRPEIVKRAIRSALKQTYRNIEIIVVDDGSTEEYDVKLPAFYYKPWEKNRGGSAARNYGLTVAKGEYIVFIDDDNMLEEKFLEKTVPCLENRPVVDAVFTDRSIVTGSSLSYAKANFTRYPGIDWGWLIRRQVFEKIRYDENIWGDEDADFGIAFINAGFTYEIIPEMLQTAFAPPENEEVGSNTFPNERRLRGLSNFLAKNLHEYSDPNERRYILRLAGRNYLRAGYYFKAVRYFWQSLIARKNWKTFKHFFFALFGWKVYNLYMSLEEKR